MGWCIVLDNSQWLRVIFIQLQQESNLEVWPETRFSPSRRFLNIDYR